jgi:hypothetical protein
MTNRKALTLKDVRRDPQLLSRFIEENPSKADRARFEKLLGAMCEPIKKPEADDQT